MATKTWLFKMNLKEAEAILISKLKGSKFKGISLVKIAEAVKTVVEHNKKFSRKKIGKKYDVSRSIIDAFYRINDHPIEIKDFINKELIGLDISTKLFTLKDKKRRVEIAKILVGLPENTSRKIIEYANKNPKLSAEKCKQIVLKSKTKTANFHLIVIPLLKEEFLNFHKTASQRKLSIEQAAKLALLKWSQKCKS